MAVPAILSGIRAEMKHLADRQRVISQNIANSETPGFKARDVAAPNFSALLAAQGGGAGGAPGIAVPTVQLTPSMAALGALVMMNTPMRSLNTLSTARARRWAHRRSSIPM